VNIIRKAAGPNAIFQSKTDPFDIYRTFVTPTMMTQILQFTNAKGMRRASFKPPPNTNWKSVTK